MWVILAHMYLCVLYLCQMDMTVNLFILVSVFGTFSHLNLVQQGARLLQSLPSEIPANTHCKQAMMCRGKHPIWQHQPAVQHLHIQHVIQTKSSMENQPEI